MSIKGANRPKCTLDLFTNDVILAFDDALRWNKCRMDIEIELTKDIFFLEVVFPSTKAHFDLNSPLIGREKKLNFLRFFIVFLVPPFCDRFLRPFWSVPETLGTSKIKQNPGSVARKQRLAKIGKRASRERFLFHFGGHLGSFFFFLYFL